MDKYSTLVWLLPIIFILHDFEEIIFFKVWLNNNKEYLAKRFPKISKHFIPRFEKMTTSAFSLAVAEEFILLSLITLCSVIFDNYLLWLAAFMGFFVHLLAHLVQWIIVKRYIPAIYTTLLSLIYCVYVLYVIISNHLFLISEIALWTIIGVGLVGLNLVLAHKLAEKFNNLTKK
jgi:hypothetical protein